MELLIARNPDPDSTLPYLMRVPLRGGLVFRTRGTWPRTGALYCHPVPVTEWPPQPDLVESVPLRSCERRGPAIDLVADRSREARSQIVSTTARGRRVVFWQSPRTRKQARPQVALPTARASGILELEILVDTREHYPYRFATQQVSSRRQALACGDYAVTLDGEVVAAVERKSLPDLMSSLTSGKLRYAVSELAGLGRAAVVVEERYSQVFAQTLIRPAVIADGIAELQVRYPNVPIVFCDTRKLAEEWTYRYLAAAHTWIASETGAAWPEDEVAAPAADDPPATPPVNALGALPPAPRTAAIREWARSRGHAVSGRGRLSAEVLRAWSAAHRPPD